MNAFAATLAFGSNIEEISGVVGGQNGMKGGMGLCIALVFTVGRHIRVDVPVRVCSDRCSASVFVGETRQFPFRSSCSQRRPNTVQSLNIALCLATPSSTRSVSLRDSFLIKHGDSRERLRRRVRDIRAELELEAPACAPAPLCQLGRKALLWSPDLDPIPI